MKTLIALIERINSLRRKDHDVVLVICGAEGSGKSNLGLHILDIINPKAVIEDVGFNIDGFIFALHKAKKYGTPVFDEAGDGLYSRDAMTKFNKILNKTYMAIRGLNLFTILILPDFFDLDPYFRKHRVKGIFYVPRRGQVRIYNKQQIDKINLFCTKSRNLNFVKPSIYDNFPIYKGHLAADYKKLKLKKIRQTQKDISSDIYEIDNKKALVVTLLKRQVKPLQISDIVACTTSYISQIKKELSL